MASSFFPFEPDRGTIQDSILLRVSSVHGDLASSGIRAHGFMADHKLKGALGARDKRPSHGLSRSLAMEERRMENLLEDIGEYKMKEKKI